MRRHAQGQIRAGRKTRRCLSPALGAALCALGLAACEPDASAPEPILSQLGTQVIPAVAFTPGHLGQIRVRVEGRGTRSSDARVRVEARFASFIGMDAPYVRLRADMPTPAADLLAAGNCRSKASLEQIASELAAAPAPVEERDLSMVDVGEIHFSLGDQRFDLPYALAPDWLPWMSGLEYRFDDSSMAALAVEPHGPTLVSIDIQGNPESGFKALRLRDELALPLRELSASVELGALSLSWAPAAAFSWPLEIELSLAPKREDLSRVDSTVVCMVDDRGDWKVGIEELREAGLDLQDWSTERPLEVRATRLNRSLATSGAFDEVELLLESSDRFTLRP